MLTAMALLAAAIGPSSTGQPTLGRPLGYQAEWIRDEDSAKAGGGGAVRFKVIFTPDGLPNKCAIEATTRNPSVDKLVCELVASRFRFKQSTNAAGGSVYRVFVRAANFDQTGSRFPQGIEPAPFVTVPSERGNKWLRSSVVVDVDEKGALLACSSPVDAKIEMQTAAAAACQAITGSWKPMPEMNASGLPIRYVRDLPFEYQVPKAGATNVR